MKPVGFRTPCVRKNSSVTCEGDTYDLNVVISVPVRCPSVAAGRRRSYRRIYRLEIGRTGKINVFETELYSCNPDVFF